MMLKDRQRIKSEMNWIRPHLFQREYELWLKGQPVAVLQQIGYLTARAELLEVAGSERRIVLELSRTGLFRQHLQVNSLDFRFPTLATADIRWNGRTELKLDNGQNYTWQPKNLWQTHWALSHEAGTEFIDIQRNPMGFGGRITVEPAEVDDEIIRFLLYIGWYLVILKMDDAAAAAASAS